MEWRVGEGSKRRSRIVARLVSGREESSVADGSLDGLDMVFAICGELRQLPKCVVNIPKLSR